MHRTASLAIASILAASGAAAQGDFVQIYGEFSDCGVEVSPGQYRYYQLRGQSVYFSNRTSSLTTGGPLEGVGCRNEPLGQFNVSFFEWFPEENLTDYLTFGYFGVVDTITAYDTDSDGFEDYEEVTDTSFVMAIRGSLGEGAVVESFFPMLDEATLVAALTTTFDSPEFFDALFTAVGHPDLTADIQVRQVNGQIANVIRPGEHLTLIAFKGGELGDEGQAIGTLSTDIARIPERLCADQNGDGLVTPADFSAWVANYNANNMRADVNADNAVTPADFSAWVAEFNLGQFGYRCIN